MQRSSARLCCRQMTVVHRAVPDQLQTHTQITAVPATQPLFPAALSHRISLRRHDLDLPSFATTAPNLFRLLAIRSSHLSGLQARTSGRTTSSGQINRAMAHLCASRREWHPETNHDLAADVHAAYTSRSGMARRTSIPRRSSISEAPLPSPESNVAEASGCAGRERRGCPQHSHRQHLRRGAAHRVQRKKG